MLEHMNMDSKESTRNLPYKSRVGGIVVGVILFIIGGMIGSFVSIYWIAGHPSFLPNNPIQNVSMNTNTMPGTTVNSTTSEGSSTEIILSHDPIVTVAASVSQSVAKIEVFQMSPYGWQKAGSGSGFLVSEEGLIVTNNHVVESAEHIKVAFKNGEEFEAELVGTDNISDIALLKIDGSNMPYLELADSNDIQVGASVIAIGNPYGYEYTVTKGVISAIQREISIPEQNSQPDSFFDGIPFFNIPNQQQQQQQKPTIPMVGIVQTDAAINPGNSGGPLVNMEGKVVGVNFLIDAQGQGLGFAIDATTVKKVVHDLEKYGTVSWASLGVTITENSSRIADDLKANTDEGVVVVEVPVGKARDAGIQKYDIIVGADGKKLDTPEKLITYIRSKDPGDSITLEIIRKGKTIEITAELEQLQK